MPSCTVPTFSNSVAISHMIHCEMPFSRSAIAVAAATAPTATAPLPEDQRHQRRAGDQGDAQGVVDDLEQRHQAHLRVAGGGELLHRLAREVRLALRVREQLDGGDVGVGVGHAPGHQRARVGLRLGHRGQARHEVTERQHVQPEPGEERREQPGSKLPTTPSSVAKYTPT